MKAMQAINRAKAGQLLGELQDLAKRRQVSPGVFVTLYLGLGEKENSLGPAGEML